MASRQVLPSLRGGHRRSSICYLYPFSITLLAAMVFSFYAGSMGWMVRHQSIVNSDCKCEWTDEIVEKYANQRVKDAIRRIELQNKPIAQDSTADSATSPRFGPGMSSFAVGMAKTTKQEFVKYYDFGYPSDVSPKAGGSEVLVLYQHPEAISTSVGEDRTNAIRMETLAGVPMLNARDATEQCEAMNVVVTRPVSGLKQCLAIVEGYESYHVQRWMRISDTLPLKLAPQNPLQIVGRGHQSNGADNFMPPKLHHIRQHMNQLENYLRNFKDLLAQLETLAGKVAKDNTVVVMVCNQGQSELLVNFVCAAKAKDFDLSNLLVFATDEETRDLATSLGLTATYDQTTFASTPNEEAKQYGDKTFGAMMYAKVVCVQTILTLGYNVLFQDVDLVWLRYPMDRIQSEEYSQFDVLFQDDGARSVRYAPYSANSGFYYVKHNPTTLYLFTSLLYLGDVILATGSHQQALSALLTEFSSLYGLKVKTLPADDWPGGSHYHRQTDYMRQLLIPEYTTTPPDPWIFHMSWTKNKDHKLLFFKQMGLWYVQDDHVTCSSDPLVSCHYRDKPAILDCSSSPPLDTNGRFFWQAPTATK